MHDVSDGLFAEIEALRGVLRNAWCRHGYKLITSCYWPDCENNRARDLLKQEAGAQAKKAIEVMR